MKEFLKILIADDEEEARSLIRFYLDETKAQYHLSEATNGKEVLEQMKRESFDLLFLDIKMPGLTGIDVLENTERKELPAVIFTTAFDEYAVTAFDHDAIDYLLKPFDISRFEKALQKAMHYIAFVKAKKSTDYVSRLTIKAGTKTFIIPVKDIEVFQGDGIYVQVITGDKTYLFNKPLYELQTMLPPSDFIRVHKSYIVNVHAIKQINSLLNGDYTVLLKNNKEIKASRTYSERLKEVLGAR